ncbi:MAG: hypothetical protein EBE86_034975 [Hormoscilla sp. GUM202]|nr:hypothetical protein [Hormoscilla sp. GUM202]
MATKDRIREQLTILTALCESGNSSEILERSLDKIIAHELAVSQQQATELAEDLQQFEAQHQMSSSDFARRFQAGELGDDVDFVEWNAFYKMWCSVQKRLKILG